MPEPGASSTSVEEPRHAVVSNTNNLRHLPQYLHNNLCNQFVLYVTGSLMQSYPARALDRRLQEDWAKNAREGPRVLMSLRVDFGPMD